MQGLAPTSSQGSYAQAFSAGEHILWRGAFDGTLGRSSEDAQESWIPNCRRTGNA